MTKHNQYRALVTGGAGLIGSHIVDMLLKDGWKVRILDNLSQNTHSTKPLWIPDKADFMLGDICNKQDLLIALDNIDVVFHQAAYIGYMPDICKYIEVNSLGTANILELIRDKNLPIKKVIVASSQVVYNEGAAHCPHHNMVFPKTRPMPQLLSGDWDIYCPLCNCKTTSLPTPESTPIGGETVYAITKLDQEKLVLSWGRQVGIPTVALRYSCTYGPRQSLLNPYTGVIAIFFSRLLNNLPPVIYEDGNQIRDMCFVEDIANANLLAAYNDGFNGYAINIGSGIPISVNKISEIIRDTLKLEIQPLYKGEFRPGEVRNLYQDISFANRLGYQPNFDIYTGIEKYLQWIKGFNNIKEYFSAAEELLKKNKIIHKSQQ